MGMEEIASLMLVIRAKDEASEMLAHVKEHASEAGEHMGGLGKAGMVAGAALSAGLAVAGTAMVGFAVEGVAHTEEMGHAAFELGERMGITGSQASLLIGIGGQLGLSAEDATRSFTKMGKGMEAADQAQQRAAATGKTANDIYSQMGIKLDDAHGHLRSMNDVLGDVADRFQKMPDGPEKTAAAIKMFGKSGADMIPMLNEGREGLARMGDAATANGAVMSDAAVKGAQQLFLAHKNLDQATSSLGMTIGTALLPIATTFANFLAKDAVPAIRSVVDWVGGQLGPVFRAAGDAISPLIDMVGKTLVPVLTGLWNNVAGGTGGISSTAMPILTTFRGVFPIIQQAVTDAWNIIKPIFDSLVRIIEQNAMPVFRELGRIGQEVAQILMRYWQAVWGALQPIFEDISRVVRDNVMPMFERLATTFTTVVMPAIRQYVLPAINSLVDTFKTDVLPILAAVADFVVTRVVPALTAIVSFILEHVVPIIMPVLGFALGLLVGSLKLVADTIHGVLVGAFHVIGDTIGWVAWVVGGLGGAFGTAFGAVRTVVVDVKNWIGDRVGEIVGFFTGIPDRIGGIGGALGGAISGGFKSAINTVINLINGFIGYINAIQIHIPEIGVGPVHSPSFDWGGLNLGKIPTLPAGGIVMPQTGGTIVRLAEAGYPEMVTPMGGGGMGATPLVIQLVLDKRVIGEVAVDQISRTYRQQAPRLGAA